MNPIGHAYVAARRYQRVVNNLPRLHRNAPVKPNTISATPIPTMMREGEEHRQHRRPVCLGEILQARIAAVQVVLEDEPAQPRNRNLGPVTLTFLVRDSEQHERAAGPVFSQCPSMAATLAGWYSRVFKPC